MAGKASTPPPTEILSVTKENLPSTSPKEELAETPPSEEITAPGQTQEPPIETEPAFTVDEETGEQVVAGTEEEPTGDPLKDTQAAFHEQSQKVASLERVLAGIVAQQGITGKPSTETAGPPAELLSTEPTEEEKEYPILYSQRMEKRREYLATVNSMQDFIDHNPDWQDLYPTMEQIRNEEPGSFTDSRALPRLHKRAKERQELDGYRQAVEKAGQVALQAGVNLEKSRGGKPFVSPTGARKTTGKSTPPADFPNWDTDKQLQWLKANGFYKETML